VIPAPPDVRALFDPAEPSVRCELTGDMYLPPGGDPRCGGDGDWWVAVEIVAFDEEGEPMIVVDGYPKLKRASAVAGYYALYRVDLRHLDAA
jgi:hypothetical protein